VMTEACCPPGSTPYLEASHTEKGSIEDADGVQLYFAPALGASTKALLLLPDVWGWNSGRIRAVADALAGEGYLVAVPKILTPCVGEGTDGDALPPEGVFSLDWIKNFPWPTQKPKVDKTLGFLRAKGATKIGVVGFCYGGHPACWASSENDDIVAGVVLHPSIQLEAFAFGGSVENLVKSVKCPFQIMPAGNDVPKWAEEGDYVSAFKQSAKGSEFVYHVFSEATHGWSIRGDVKDETVKRDVKIAMDEIKAFFAKHMA